MYDLLIKGARIIDGTGAPSWNGDVAIKSGRIVAMGHLDGEAAILTYDSGDEVAKRLGKVRTCSHRGILLIPRRQPN